MKRNPKNASHQKTIQCALLILFLLIIGIGGSLIVYSHQSERRIACIYQNGILIRTIDLNDAAENTTFTISGENGASNTVEVRHGEIGVIAASCPDKVCVHMGFIKNDMLPITCLPNRLVIKIESGFETDGSGSKIDGLSR